MRNTGDSPQPVAHVLLALGNIVEKDGTPLVASSDLSSPRSLTDNVECFVFNNIPSGKYTLIFDRVDETFLLSHPDYGGDLIIAPQVGQVLDLGKLIYSNLPIPTPMR